MGESCEQIDGNAEELWILSCSEYIDKSWNKNSTLVNNWKRPKYPLKKEIIIFEIYLEIIKIN